MTSQEAELKCKHIVKLNCGLPNRQSPVENGAKFLDDESDAIGGFLENGKFSWIAFGRHLDVNLLRNGNKVASYQCHVSGAVDPIITCVTEVQMPDVRSCILAIGMQCAANSGLIVIFAVHGSRILRTIQVRDRVTSCTLISDQLCSFSRSLKFIDGCLAVGTENGRIFLLELDFKRCKEVLFRNLSVDDELIDCDIIDAEKSTDIIKQRHKQSVKAGMSLAIQLEMLSHASPILSILAVDSLVTLIVGFEDGRMVLYDLMDRHPYHLAYPHDEGGNKEEGPLVKLSFMEPSDDPRACAYIWAFHSGPKTSVAVMHAVVFEHRRTMENGGHLYEKFQACSGRLTLPIFEAESTPLSCQCVKKVIPYEEDVLSLCSLGWTSKRSSNLLIFDLNQWYKAQMPSFCDWRKFPNYLAHFRLEKHSSLDVFFDVNSISPFNTIQRPEEHFFPISLSFDCLHLTESICSRMHWVGLQNSALDYLNASGPTGVLEPVRTYNALVYATMVPLFTDPVPNNIYQTLNARREYILSVALEYNCVGMLKQCARLWADGSHLGRQVFEGLSLSTLTDWIWNRTTRIKDCCNDLCVPLFDGTGSTIDHRTQRTLSHCSRQLKLLAELMQMILTSCCDYIPSDINEMLTQQQISIQMASEYQEVLQWLLNIGLLPEGSHRLSVDSDIDDGLIPFPYTTLQRFYTNRRQKYEQICQSKQLNWNCLFIDAFVEQECNPAVLKRQWRLEGGTGYYPPASLQSMLRILLISEFSTEKKYALFIYLFLDLHLSLSNKKYNRVTQNFIKFPAVFNLDPALIMTIQAFWNLDHGNFEEAVSEIISSLSNTKQMSSWQQELLIKVLLLQNLPQLALKTLRVPSPPISPSLTLQTLLANDMTAEAFQLQRSRGGDLLVEFFEICFDQGKYNAILKLALTEDEGNVLGKVLKSSPKICAGENLHFAYLLNRCKYSQALQLLEDLQKRGDTHLNDFKTPNLMLSAYKLTMTPLTGHLSDMFFETKQRRQVNSRDERLQPLSCDLLRNKLDITHSGVYQRCLSSTDEADTSVYSEISSTADMPFLRRPQSELFWAPQKLTLVEPLPYQPVTKRPIDRDASDIQENVAPNKRRKYVPSNIEKSFLRNAGQDINASLLTSFKERTTNYGGTRTIEEQESDEEDITKTKSLLSTPIVRRRDDQTNAADAVTPHSILKHRIPDIEESSLCSTPDRSVSPTQVDPTQSTDVHDERSIRFDLPSPNSSNQCYDSAVRVSPKKRVAIHSSESTSISGDVYFSLEDSPTKSVNLRAESVVEESAIPIRTVEEMSGDDMSIDEDSSPPTPIVESSSIERLKKLSAKLNSKDEEIKLSESVIEKESLVLQRPFFADRLQPRKAIRSGIVGEDVTQNHSEVVENVQLDENMSRNQNLSSSPRSRKSRSRTPEVVPLSPSRRSERLIQQQSSTISEISGRSAINNHISKLTTQRNKLPLSRLVLETNAKKLVMEQTVAQSHDGISNETTMSLEESTFATTSFMGSQLQSDGNLSESSMSDFQNLSPIYKEPHIPRTPSDQSMEFPSSADSYSLSDVSGYVEPAHSYSTVSLQTTLSEEKPPEVEEEPVHQAELTDDATQVVEDLTNVRTEEQASIVVPAFASLPTVSLDSTENSFEMDPSSNTVAEAQTNEIASKSTSVQESIPIVNEKLVERKDQVSRWDVECNYEYEYESNDHENFLYLTNNATEDRQRVVAEAVEQHDAEQEVINVLDSSEEEEEGSDDSVAVEEDDFESDISELISEDDLSMEESNDVFVHVSDIDDEEEEQDQLPYEYESNVDAEDERVNRVSDDSGSFRSSEEQSDVDSETESENNAVEDQAVPEEVESSDLVGTQSETLHQANDDYEPDVLNFNEAFVDSPNTLEISNVRSLGQNEYDESVSAFSSVTTTNICSEQVFEISVDISRIAQTPDTCIAFTEVSATTSSIDNATLSQSASSSDPLNSSCVIEQETLEELPALNATGNNLNDAVFIFDATPITTSDQDSSQTQSNKLPVSNQSADSLITIVTADVEMSSATNSPMDFELSDVYDDVDMQEGDQGDVEMDDVGESSTASMQTAHLGDMRGQKLVQTHNNEDNRVVQHSEAVELKIQEFEHKKLEENVRKEKGELQLIKQKEDLEKIDAEALLQKKQQELAEKRQKEEEALEIKKLEVERKELDEKRQKEETIKLQKEQEDLTERKRKEDEKQKQLEADTKAKEGALKRKKEQEELEEKKRTEEKALEIKRQEEEKKQLEEKIKKEEEALKLKKKQDDLAERKRKEEEKQKLLEAEIKEKKEALKRKKEQEELEEKKRIEEKALEIKRQEEEKKQLEEKKKEEEEALKLKKKQEDLAERKRKEEEKQKQLEAEIKEIEQELKRKKEQEELEEKKRIEEKAMEIKRQDEKKKQLEEKIKKEEEALKLKKKQEDLAERKRKEEEKQKQLEAEIKEREQALKRKKEEEELEEKKRTEEKALEIKRQEEEKKQLEEKIKKEEEALKLKKKQDDLAERKRKEEEIQKQLDEEIKKRDEALKLKKAEEELAERDRKEKDALELKIQKEKQKQLEEKKVKDEEARKLKEQKELVERKQKEDEKRELLEEKKRMEEKEKFKKQQTELAEQKRKEEILELKRNEVKQKQIEEAIEIKKQKEKEEALELKRKEEKQKQVEEQLRLKNEQKTLAETKRKEEEALELKNQQEKEKLGEEKRKEEDALKLMEKLQEEVKLKKQKKEIDEKNRKEKEALELQKKLAEEAFILKKQKEERLKKQEEIKKLKEKQQEEPMDVDETENPMPLLQLQVSESESDDSDKSSSRNFKSRKTRVRISSKELLPTALEAPRLKHSLRATSVTKSEMEPHSSTTTSPARRTRRSMSTAEHENDSPVSKSRRFSIVLDRIDEGLFSSSSNTPSGKVGKRRDSESSSVSTSSKTPKIKTETGVLTPSTPVRRSRRLSHGSQMSIDDHEDAGSRYNLRNRVVDEDDRSSVRSGMAHLSENVGKMRSPDDDTASVKSNTSTASSQQRGRTLMFVQQHQHRHHNEDAPHNEEDDYDHDEYSASRRLTRSQQAMMEKINEQKKTLEHKSYYLRSKDHDSDEDGNVSDSESIVSKVSKGSKRSQSSTTKGKKVKGKRNLDDLETASIASSTRSTRSKASRVSKTDQVEKKSSPVVKNLTAIVEMDEEDEEDQAGTSKAGRSTKRKQ